MNVYIEYVIIDNFILDYIILYGVARTLRLRIKKLKITSAAVIGTILSVAVPLLKWADAPILALKIATGFVMVLFISPFDFKKIIMSYVFFITYTFVLGGCILGVLFLLEANPSLDLTLSYNYSIPVGLIIGVCCIYIMLLIKLVKYMEHKKNILPFVRKIKIIYNNREYESKGFIDSGNRIYDEDGKPVMVISSTLAEKMLSRELFIKLYGGLYKGNEFKRKEYSGASSKQAYMYIFKIMKLLIYSEDKVNTIVNVSVGAVTGDYKSLEGCEALLHGDMI